MIRSIVAISVTISAFGCAAAKPDEQSPRETQSEKTQRPQKELENKCVIQWINDDYESARAKANEHEVPLLIYISAEWCYPCSLMDRFVFSDDRLESLANRLVWLKLDTDNELNIETLGKLPIKVHPSFFLLDAKTESIIGEHSGAASVDEFISFVEKTDAGQGD